MQRWCCAGRGLSGSLGTHFDPSLLRWLVMPSSSLGKQTAVQTELPVTQEGTLQRGNSEQTTPSPWPQDCSQVHRPQPEDTPGRRGPALAPASPTVEGDRHA